MPVAESNLSIIAAATDADRAALLLAATETIRKRIVGCDVIELRRRLVVPTAPCPSAIDGDDGSLIASKENDLCVDGIDPDVLIVVAAGRAANARPGLPSVNRLPANNACRIKDVCVLRVKPKNRKVAAADACGGARVCRRLPPALTAVV